MQWKQGARMQKFYFHYNVREKQYSLLMVPFSCLHSHLWLLCIQSFGRIASVRIYWPDRVAVEAGRRSEEMWIIKFMWLDWENAANGDHLPRSLSTINRGKRECPVPTGLCTQYMPSALFSRSTRSRQMGLNEKRLNPHLLFWCTPTSLQTTKRHHRSWSWPEVEV